MSILPAMQSAALRLVGQKPAVFFTSSDQFELEIVDLLQDVANDICKYHDWQALTKINVMNGDGTTKEFPLPDDYDRQLLYTVVQDINHWMWGYTHVSDINTFLAQQYMSFGTNPGIWTIYQNKMHFIPAPSQGNNATFPYISLNYAIDSNNAGKPEFTSDTDEFIIRGGNELLKLGIIWRWRENKKLDYTGDQEAFTMALEQLAARDKGSNVFRQYSASNFRNTPVSYPFPLGQ
jgi:hypothetical protein